MVGGDVDGGELRSVGALVGHAVHRLDLEAVLRVRLQVAHGHAALHQAQVARRDLHVVVAAGAHAALRQALLADDVVEDVVAAARLARVAPLQHQRGLVDVGDDAARGRGHRWVEERVGEGVRLGCGVEGALGRLCGVRGKIHFGAVASHHCTKLSNVYTPWIFNGMRDPFINPDSKM